MTTYHIAAGPQMTLGKKVVSQVARTGLFLLLYAVSLRVLEGHWRPPALFAILGTVLLLFNLLTNFLWQRQAPSYDLEIGDDGIRMLWNRKVFRTVRKDRARYIGVWGRGAYRRLVVSEHGPAFTRWLWGGIGVPASLPEYEPIKTEILTWMNSKS
jgi:hypothetical protein